MLPYYFGLICQQIGKPCFIVGTTGSYKSTVVEAVAEYYESEGWSVLFPDTLKVRDMKKLSEEINQVGQHKVVNLFLEDFSHVAQGYRLRKLAEFIGALAEDKRYIDYGNKIVIKGIKGLGFLGAIQPSWIRKLVQSTSWDTFYRQRFVRYHQLPMFPSEKAETLYNDYGKEIKEELIDQLVGNTEKIPASDERPDNTRLKKAFEKQLGGGSRALITYREFMKELDRWTVIPEKLADLFAGRLMIEDEFIKRWYDQNDRDFKADIEVGACHCCWHVLDYNNGTSKLDYDTLADRLDLSKRTIRGFVSEAQDRSLILKKKKNNPKVHLETGSKLRKYTKGVFDVDRSS